MNMLLPIILIQVITDYFKHLDFFLTFVSLLEIMKTGASTVPPDKSTERPSISIIKPNFPRVSIPFVIAMWVFSTCAVKLGKCASNCPKVFWTYTTSLFLTIVLNSWPKLISWVPESCCLILVGIIGGFVLHVSNTPILSPLSSTIFFFCMLPPIILDAGYFMPNRPFFDHLGTILLFAVVGTIFNALTIGIRAGTTKTLPT